MERQHIPESQLNSSVGETALLENDNNTAVDCNNNSASSAKPKKISKIYQKYDAIPNDDKHVRCKVCKEMKVLDPKGSSGNLNKHYTRMHPTLCDNNKNESSVQPSSSPQLQQRTIQESFQKERFNQEQFEQKLTHWIIKSCQPFTVVEEESFKKMIAFCNPKANTMSANTIKRRITALYQEEKEQLKNVLKDTPGKISIILDAWTSRNMYGFQGIIAQWIDKDWNLRSLVLDLDHLVGRHTGRNLAKSLVGVLTEFDILGKIVAVTTDNASNMDTMFTEFKKLMLQNGEYFSEENSRVRCLAHVINLACQAALSQLRNGEVDDVDSEDDLQGQSTPSKPSSELTPLQKVKKAVARIRKSTPRRETFESACALSKIEHKELILDMIVRWNTTYLMLVRVLELRDPFEATLRGESKLSKYLLIEEHWKNINDIIEFLKPFYEMTKYISKKIPTMALSGAVYIELYNHLESCTVDKGKSEFIQSAAVSACDKLNKYYPSTDGLVYIIGTVLDPRCKLEWHRQVDFDSQVIKGYRKSITDYWTTHYKPTTEDHLAINLDTVADLCARQMKKAKIEKRDELQRYLGDPVEAVIPDNNILVWWQANENKFPNLSRMARDFLAVCGTGVPIERFFSSGPDLLAARRLSLSPETIRMCLTLKAWLKHKTESYYIDSQISELIASKMLGETFFA